MKISHVINQLRAVLPKYTDYFSTVLIPASVAVSATEAIFEFAAPHGLTDGESVTISDVSVETVISDVTRNGNIYTFTTDFPHDLTENFQETVKFSGFSNSDWNDEFPLLYVPSRYMFSIQSALPDPVLSGGERLLEIRNAGVNGRWQIVESTSTSFKITGEFLAGIYTGGKVNAQVRVSGGVEMERVVEQYTEQNLNDFWMFAVPASVVVSKDRNALSDATATKMSGDNMHLRVLDGFSIYIIKNTTQDIAALDAIDLCRHDLLLPVLKSVYGVRFPTGVTGSGDFRTVLTGHALSAYNKAFIVYGYDFEVPLELTEADAAVEDDSAAFRDIDFTEKIGSQEMTVNIPLDG